MDLPRSLPTVRHTSSTDLIDRYYFGVIMRSVGLVESQTQFYVNGSLVVVSLIVSVTCASLVDRVGRRPLFVH